MKIIAEAVFNGSNAKDIIEAVSPKTEASNYAVVFAEIRHLKSPKGVKDFNDISFNWDGEEVYLEEGDTIQLLEDNSHQLSVKVIKAKHT